MVADGLLTRQRYREVPPRVDYELTERARDLLPIVGALARWGYQWTWSAPREGEAIDIGAVLRSLPGLAAPKGVRGSVQLVVVRPEDEGGDKHYAVTAKKGQVAVVETELTDAKTTIRGPQDAWVRALGPDADRKGLKMSGDKAVAGALLDGLVPFTASVAAVA